MLHFIARLVHQTRNHKSIYLGASPGFIGNNECIKSYRCHAGKGFCNSGRYPEVVAPVLRHRIILAPDKEMEGISEDEVIKQIIQGMDVPR